MPAWVVIAILVLDNVLDDFHLFAHQEGQFCRACMDLNDRPWTQALNTQATVQFWAWLEEYASIAKTMSFELHVAGHRALGAERRGEPAPSERSRS